jgi:hypothetical protein
LACRCPSIVDFINVPQPPLHGRSSLNVVGTVSPSRPISRARSTARVPHCSKGTVSSLTPVTQIELPCVRTAPCTQR